MATFSIGKPISELKRLLKLSPAGNYLFYGPEEFLKRAYLKSFQKLASENGMGDFNIVRLDFSRDATMAELKEAAETLPLMSEYRLVEIRGLMPLKLNEADAKLLISILKEKYEGLILIIYCTVEELEIDKTNAKKKIISELSSLCTVVFFDTQTNSDILAWLNKKIAKEGISASDKTLKLLMELKQNDMFMLQNEIDKLINFALFHKKAEITEKDVEILVSATEDVQIYAFSNAVAELDTTKAAKILKVLAYNKIDPVWIASTLTRTLSQICAAVYNMTQKNAYDSFAVNEWILKNYKSSFLNADPEFVLKAMNECLLCEQKLKSINADKYVVLEETYMKVIDFLKCAKKK